MNNNFYKSLVMFSWPLTLFIIVFSLYGASIKDGYIFDSGGFILGRDFVNMWHYGMSAFFDDPGRFYNSTKYNLKLDELIVGHDYINQQFSYPPHFMLLSAPFGLMPYNLALASFTILGLGSFWKVIVAPLDKPKIKILLSAPVLAIALLAGQLSLLLVVIFALIMRTMDKKPWIAAILIALLTVKPQIGFLFPIYLMATRRYNLFLYTTITSIGFIGISIVLLGLDVWVTYITSAMGNQAAAMINSGNFVLGLMPTLYVNLVLAGLPVMLAQIIHGATALFAIIVMFITVRKTSDMKFGYAVFIATTFVATPYLMVYDTLLLLWAAILLATTVALGTLDKIAISLLVALPIIGVVMALSGLSGYALIIWMLFLCIIKHKNLSHTDPNRQDL